MQHPFNEGFPAPVLLAASPGDTGPGWFPNVSPFPTSAGEQNEEWENMEYGICRTPQASFFLQSSSFVIIPLFSFASRRIHTPLQNGKDTTCIKLRGNSICAVFNAYLHQPNCSLYKLLSAAISNTLKRFHRGQESFLRWGEQVEFVGKERGGSAPPISIYAHFPWRVPFSVAVLW